MRVVVEVVPDGGGGGVVLPAPTTSIQLKPQAIPEVDCTLMLCAPAERAMLVDTVCHV